MTSVKPATMALTCLRWTCSCGAPRSLGRPHGAGLPAWPAHASVLDLNVHHRPPHTDGGRMLRSTGHTNPHPLHHQTGVTPTPASLSRPPQLSPPHEALLASSPRSETLQAFAWTVQPALSHGGSPSSLQAAEWGRSPSTPASAARTEGAGQGLSGVPGMKQACLTATYKPVNAAASCRGGGGAVEVRGGDSDLRWHPTPIPRAPLRTTGLAGGQERASATAPGSPRARCLDPHCPVQMQCQPLWGF